MCVCVRSWFRHANDTTGLGDDPLVTLGGKGFLGLDANVQSVCGSGQLGCSA